MGQSVVTSGCASEIAELFSKLSVYEYGEAGQLRYAMTASVFQP